MTDSLPETVVPYSRFQEYHDRRRKISEEPTPTPRDQPPTTNADVVPAPITTGVPTTADAKSC